MNATPARRRWFQLHLSTALVLVLFLAFALYLNLYYANYVDKRYRDKAYLIGYPYLAIVVLIKKQADWGWGINDYGILEISTHSGIFEVFLRGVVKDLIIFTFGASLVVVGMEYYNRRKRVPPE